MAGYIKERTKNAQFIVISLRNNMFELAERLVGIYKVSHMTKSVTVENKDYLAMRRQQRTQEARLQQQRMMLASLPAPSRPQRPGTASSQGSQTQGRTQLLSSQPAPAAEAQ